MEILTLPEALQLYLLMKSFLPDRLLGITPIDFIRQLVDNIIQAGQPRIYLEIVSLMTKVEIDVLITNTPEDVLKACIDGLILNQVLELIDFCRKIGL